MGASERSDSWASGVSYHQFVGRWSRLIAVDFIRWLDVPPNRQWLDIGCGTGSLSRAILELASPVSVQGVDPSISHIAFALDTIKDGRAAFFVGTIEDMQLPGDSCDVVVSGLVLNFLPDIARGLAEMKRIVRQQGIIAAYVWDYADKMKFLRHFWNAAIALDHGAIVLDEGRRFPLCRPEPLEQLFISAGLKRVDVCPIDVPTQFQDFDDYWLPFLGGQGPAPGYAVSLSEEGRNRLRDRIRSTLPVAEDGSITLTARAWAIKGLK